MIRRLFYHTSVLLLLALLTGCTSILGSGEVALPRPVGGVQVQAPAAEAPAGQMPAPLPLVLPGSDSQTKTGSIPNGHKGDPNDPDRCKKLQIPDNKTQGRDGKQVEVMRWAKKAFSSGGELEGFPLRSSNIAEMTKYIETHSPTGGWGKEPEAVLLDILFVKKNAREVFDEGGCHIWPAGLQQEMNDIEKFFWELQLPIA